VEAGILPVCVAILRQDTAAQLDWDGVLFYALKLLRCVLSKLFGLHPFLSAGVLLPHVCRVAQSIDDKRPIDEAAQFVSQFGYRRRHSLHVELRPIISASAAARAVEAACQQRLTSQSHMAPVDRVDSDALCVISSFLCGCDFLRVIRVCRRWAGLRLKPAAWSSAQPCDVHIDEHVAAFFPLFQWRDTVESAFTAFLDFGSAGVRRLVEVGVLDSLLPFLEEAWDRRSWQHTALWLLQQISWSDECAHASLLVSHSIFGKLNKLMHRNSKHMDYSRSRACAVLAGILYGCTCAELDATVQGGLIPVLTDFAVSGKRASDSAVEALTWICLRGDESHRHALVDGDVLPVLAEAVQHRMRSSANQSPEQHNRWEIGHIIDLLRSISLLLRTAKSMDAAAAVATPLPSAAARKSKAHCIPCAELENFREHWHPKVRAEVANVLRERAD
jgi:hypothetical protein